MRRCFVPVNAFSGVWRSKDLQKAFWKTIIGLLSKKILVTLHGFPCSYYTNGEAHSPWAVELPISINLCHDSQMGSSPQVDKGKKKPNTFLDLLEVVGGFNPFEKYARQNGNLPQVGMKITKYFKPPPS